jgi:hypothetical protein
MENEPTSESPDRLRSYAEGQSAENPEVKSYMEQGLTRSEALDLRSLFATREASNSKFKDPQIQIYLDKMAAFNEAHKKDE